MSESPCLRRSLSHPSSSIATGEFKEGDGGPIRALTESISFGRFVSDSLDWEKWSFFNSNRYIEEAEKFSKTGSVAQKKAFFEARYKKKAATQEGTQIAEVAVHSDSEAREVSMHLDEIKQVDDDTSLEKQTTGKSSVETSFPADESKSTVALLDIAEEKDVLQLNRAHVPEELRAYEKKEPLTEFINPQLVIFPDDPQLLFVQKGTTDGPNLNSHKEKEVKSSASASAPIRTLTSKVAKAMTSFQARTANNATGIGQKSASKSTGPRSLHMSINLASASGLSQSWKTRGTNFSPTFEKESSSSTSTQNQLKAPVSKHSSGSQSSNVKRIASVLNKSMTEPMRMTTDNKSNSLRPSHSRCSTIAETRAKPAAACTPFGLRSAERAQKRKEFFLMKQERITVKEAEKKQLVQRNQPPTARPSPPESVNNLTSTHSCVSQSRRRTAAPSSLHVIKHTQENTSPNLPV